MRARLQPQRLRRRRQTRLQLTKRLPMPLQLRQRRSGCGPGEGCRRCCCSEGTTRPSPGQAGTAGRAAVVRLLRELYGRPGSRRRTDLSGAARLQARIGQGWRRDSLRIRVTQDTPQGHRRILLDHTATAKAGRHAKSLSLPEFRCRQGSGASPGNLRVERNPTQPKKEGTKKQDRSLTGPAF